MVQHQQGVVTLIGCVQTLVIRVKNRVKKSKSKGKMI